VVNSGGREGKVDGTDQIHGSALLFLNELYNISFKASGQYDPSPTDKRLRNVHGCDTDDDQWAAFCSSTYKQAHVVEYYYLIGRKALFEANYSSAHEALDWAFMNCPSFAFANKRKILLHLIPVKLKRGQVPSMEMMKRFGLDEMFGNICVAVGQGNLIALERELKTRQASLVRWGLYLILLKLRLIAYRNLFKKVQAVLKAQFGGSPETARRVFQVKFSVFQTALSVRQPADQPELSLDEVECIIANLIVKGYIKGYIAHGQKVVVLSKTNPFPKLQDVRT
jgi:hypothetical protein